MKKKLTRALLACLLVLTMILACGCKSGSNSSWKVTFYESDGVTVLKEVEAEDGKPVDMPELAKEGYVIEGYYATPALMVPFDTAAPITEDTAVFVAWQSSVEDNRPWMLAGALRGYPDNAWGKIWPQDDYLLEKVDGEFNTFQIEVNLYAGDSFKIAVIGEGYAWDNTASIDASHLANKTADAVMCSGENAFDSGANIEVKEDGKYRLTLRTDAETLSLCKLSYERIGDADELKEVTYDMKLWASFNDWAGQDMTRNGDDLIWYCEADVPAGGGEFGVKNAATGDWYSSEGNTKNIALEEGHYMFFIELELVDGKPQLKGDIVAAEPAYYVVGTCGNAGWAADANADNTAYKMTVDWADNKVAFKLVYGCGGRVDNEYWYGGDGGANITVDPGDYTITFDPAAGTITVK